MADYDYIPINASAERIEKIAQMDINSSVLNEESNDNSLPTSKLVFEELKKSEENNKIIVDEIYNPESENAQSGKAVAEAIDSLATKNVNEGTLDFRKPDVHCVQLPFAEIQSIETYNIDILKEPEEDTDAVNKGYVDNLVGDIDAALDAIIALQNSIIGCESV